MTDDYKNSNPAELLPTDIKNIRLILSGKEFFREVSDAIRLLCSEKEKRKDSKKAINTDEAAAWVYIRSEEFNINIKQMLYSSAKEWADLPQMFEDQSYSSYLADYLYVLEWYLQYSDAIRNRAFNFEIRLAELLMQIILSTGFHHWKHLVPLFFGWKRDTSYQRIKADETICIGCAADRSIILKRISRELYSWYNVFPFADTSEVSCIIEKYMDKYTADIVPELHGTENAMVAMLTAFIKSTDYIISIEDTDAFAGRVINLLASFVYSCTARGIADEDLFFQVLAVISAIPLKSTSVKKAAERFQYLCRKYYNRSGGFFDSDILKDTSLIELLCPGLYNSYKDLGLTESCLSEYTETDPVEKPAYILATADGCFRFDNINDFFTSEVYRQLIEKFTDEFM